MVYLRLNQAILSSDHFAEDIQYWSTFSYVQDFIGFGSG